MINFNNYFNNFTFQLNFLTTLLIALYKFLNIALTATKKTKPNTRNYPDKDRTKNSYFRCRGVKVQHIYVQYPLPKAKLQLQVPYQLFFPV